MMKKIMLCAILLTTMNLVSCNKNDDNVVTNYGSLVINDVTLDVDETKDLYIQFSNNEYKEDITYEFSGNNIEIKDNKVKGLVSDTITTVKAKTTHLETTFKVKVRKANYGELIISDLTLYNGYSGDKPEVKFTNEKYIEDIEYSFDSDAIKYENGVFTSLIVNKTILVKAKTTHLETTFNIFTKEIANSNKVNNLVNKWVNDGSITNETLFIGDSFFDTEFWNNFYTTSNNEEGSFTNKLARTNGISATTATQWEKYIEKLVLPLSPKNLVIHLGTNDLFDDHRNEEYIVNKLLDIIKTIHINLVDTKIYYFSIEPRTYKASHLSSLDEIISTIKRINNSLSEEFAKLDYVTYLDSSTKFYNNDGSVNSNMFRDGTHPILSLYNSWYKKLLIDANIEIDDKVPTRNIPNINREISDTVGSSTNISYLGKALLRNYYIEGDIKVSELGNNAHIEFRFNDMGNRFLLWDQGNNKVLKVLYAINGNYAAYNSNLDKKLDFSKDMVIKFRIIATTKNAYLYINDSLSLIMSNVLDGNRSLYIGSESTKCQFYNLKALTKEFDNDEFLKKVNTEEITNIENKLTSLSTMNVYRNIDEIK